MIPLAEPNIGHDEQTFVLAAIQENHVGPGGKFVEDFEKMVADAAGRKWAIATITGSAAIDAVIYHAGCPALVRERYEHAFPAVKNTYDRFGRRTVEVVGGENHDNANYSFFADRAPAIGEPRMDVALETYSFAANKIVTCGHGGAIVGDNPDLEADLRDLIHQGYGRSGVFNYRMANINAAIGCAQMRKLERFKELKRMIWSQYKIAGFPMIERGDSRWMATMECHDQNSMFLYLDKNGVQSRIEPSGGISLPCSTNLTMMDQTKVMELVSQYILQLQDEPTSAQ